MSGVVKTCEEFSSRRKVRYGYGGASSPSNLKERAAYTLTPSTVNASLSPHKMHYGRDPDGNEAYIIDFNIGDFRFDEITIRTEGRRLIVQGKSQQQGNVDEVSREFTRDFTLPADVDQYSIKAQLDESTRQLSLFGQLKPVEKQTVNAVSSAPFTPFDNVKIGTIKENRNNFNLEYEIFLGNDLKDGQVRVDPSFSTININVNKKNWDKHGDYSLELSRQIKLPPNLNLQRIEHGVDFRTSSLVIKIPFN